MQSNQSNQPNQFNQYNQYNHNLAFMRNHRSILLLIIFILVSSASFAQDWAGFNRYNESNTQVVSAPKAVFMGDSITDNWASWDSEFFTSNNYVGRGISGQTTSHMLVRFRRDVIDLAPEYVTILAGTNDIARNNGEITLENVLGNIISMCELAKANNIKPILCAILPAIGYRWRPGIQPADDIVKLNGMIREYAERNGIPYVDYHTLLKDEHNGLPEKYAEDGVHPNVECYKLMEDLIIKYLP